MAQMNDMFRPLIEGGERAWQAKQRRFAAADLAGDNTSRPRSTISSNQEEMLYDDEQPTSFTKGLPHNLFGLVRREDYETFAAALTEPHRAFHVPLGPDEGKISCPTKCTDGKPTLPARRWESPLAGHYYDLEGPDTDAVAMAPAPRLGKSELSAEMAELYAMALVRDVPFSDLANPATVVRPSGSDGPSFTVAELVSELNKLAWFDAGQRPQTSFPEKTGSPQSLTGHECDRRLARWSQRADMPEGRLATHSLFRGSVPGAKCGPYLSQFLLIGTTRPDGGKAKNGIIAFGAQTIDQRIIPYRPGLDYMTSWAEWLDVQKGVDLVGADRYDAMRFISTPRDLATYVHRDQLYQAYFNACLIMLEAGVPFDRGFPDSPGHLTRAPFASFGGPHILSLMTEVASRALKAVRRQKFQIHRRARPEALAGMLTLVANGFGGKLGKAAPDFDAMLWELRQTRILDWIAAHNAVQNDQAHRNARDYACTPAPGLPRILEGSNYLLPIAYPEGSPMQPSYGAGHATVAGACVTVLKAFFEMYADSARTRPAPLSVLGHSEVYEGDGPTLKRVPCDGLCLQDELNKLAANVSVGRNMAGVNYYTDYYDSIRMGERIALGMLQEQMLTYDEKVSMTFDSFDGDRITIRTSGGATRHAVTVTIIDAGGLTIPLRDWWMRHIHEFEDVPIAQRIADALANRVAAAK